MFLTIKKGKHRSNWWLPKLTFKKMIIGKITFLGDHEYNIGKYQKDSNKVVGLSDNFFHHMDSIRLGFRWNSIVKRIDLVGICYNGGKREIKTITRVDANKEISFLISIEKDKYLVAVGEEFVSFERSSKWNFLRYYLFPYFGGVSKSPKDLKFKLELL